MVEKPSLREYKYQQDLEDQYVLCQDVQNRVYSTADIAGTVSRDHHRTQTSLRTKCGNESSHECSQSSETEYNGYGMAYEG